MQKTIMENDYSGKVHNVTLMNRYPDEKRFCELQLQNMNKLHPKAGQEEKVDIDDAVLDDERHGFISTCQRGTLGCCKKFGKWIARIVGIAALVGFIVYVGMGMSINPKGTSQVLIIATIVLLILLHKQVNKRYGHAIDAGCLQPLHRTFTKHKSCLSWVLGPLIILCCLLFLLLYTLQDNRQLQSLFGIVVFICILAVTSKHPNHINWRTVIVGLLCQMALCAILFRWPPMRDSLLQFLKDVSSSILNRSNAGSSVVFGDPFFLLHPFVFSVMPTLIYWSGLLAILVYTGILQAFISRVGLLVKLLLGTSAVESAGALFNIMMDWANAFILMRPYIPKLTNSEIHTFLVACHSSVGGYPFVLLLRLGAPAEHVVVAGAMAIPAAIVVSKLNYPETQKRSEELDQEFALENREETDLISATTSGAFHGAKTALAIVINMIFILAVMDFVDTTLEWLGSNVGYPELSIERICSAVFAPVSFAIGIHAKDCRDVGSLLGVKMATSEVITYTRFGDKIFNGNLSEHSIAISTYALCGSSGLVTIVASLGVWKSICPKETPIAASQLLRLFINANITCLLTAAVASFMYDPSDIKLNGVQTEPSILDLIPGYKDLL